NDNSQGSFKMCRKIFPFPHRGTASSFAEQYKKHPDFDKNVRALRDAAVAGVSDKDKQKQLYEHAKAYLKDENDRGASSIGRAQALLIAQTFFGTFLAFGTGLISQKDIFHDWRGYVLMGLLCYIVLLVLLQAFNALKATGTLNYERIGST